MSRATEQPKAVVLLSGGLDSATALAIARDQGYACHALSLDYGQRHLAELHAARRVADEHGALGRVRVHVGRGAALDALDYLQSGRADADLAVQPGELAPGRQAVDQDVAAARLLQPRDHAQQRRLPAPGRADQNHEFLVGDFQADAVDHLHFAELFDDILQNHLCHGPSHSLRVFVA